VACKDVEKMILEEWRRESLPHDNYMTIMRYDINKIPKKEIGLVVNKLSSKKWVSKRTIVVEESCGSRELRQDKKLSKSKRAQRWRKNTSVEK
jgi:hypothetical protein